MIEKGEIIRKTEEYGGAMGCNHTKRLLDLISRIGEGQRYDPESVWLAVHLHDCGGYSRWKKASVDHAERSKDVAEAFLSEKGCPQEKLKKVLAYIETHHSAEKVRSIEA